MPLGSRRIATRMGCGSKGGRPPPDVESSAVWSDWIDEVAAEHYGQQLLESTARGLGATGNDGIAREWEAHAGSSVAYRTQPRRSVGMPSPEA